MLIIIKNALITKYKSLILRKKEKMQVRAKKYLGQHFLKDENTAARIADQINQSAGTIVEIGPGMGVLTKYLAKAPADLRLIEIDTESVEYLKVHYPQLSDKIIHEDFLKLDLDKLFREQLTIAGNFPYNISSQIFFRVLKYKHLINNVVCMIQKEVAERICAGHGNKTYGILSVLLQTYFDIEYLFTVKPGVFHPPPKVNSAVIRLKNRGFEDNEMPENVFFELVKKGFNQRRKTLRNALKGLYSDGWDHEILNKRAEQLSKEDFHTLTKMISS
jgi:16S rRNA (adenine1518-N6/adenine1519-N6)-dimethyltransferase